MKKLIMFMFLSVVMTFSAMANDVEKYFETTYYAVSTHWVPGDFNSDHDMIGVEYRDDHSGFAISTFKNSHYKKTILIDYATYWQMADYVETSARFGLASGYSRSPFTLALSAAYTKYDYFRPKISWFGGAIVFSVSFKI